MAENEFSKSENVEIFDKKCVFFSKISKIFKINFQNPGENKYFGKFKKIENIRFWENQPHHLQKSDLDDEEISEIFSKENF